MDATSYYNYRAQRAAGFFELHVIMGEETRVVILATPSDGYCHNSEPFRNYFLPRLERLAKSFGFGIRYIPADSAYASNKAYEEVRERPNAIPGIKSCKRRGVPKRGLIAIYWRMRNLPWLAVTPMLDESWRRCLRFSKRLFGCYVRAAPGSLGVWSSSLRP